MINLRIKKRWKQLGLTETKKDNPRHIEINPTLIHHELSFWDIYEIITNHTHCI